MVIDAIGEWDSASIWQWRDGELRKLHSVWYPNSLGLLYSAVTQYVGLKPMEDEYILMGMAAYGNDSTAWEIQKHIRNKLFKHPRVYHNEPECLHTKLNLQKGIPEGIFEETWDHFDIAKACQNETELRISAYANFARLATGSKNLVFMGGVALNCVANSNLHNMYDLSLIHI